MNLVWMSNKERFAWMHKLNKFLHDMAKTYSSLEDFANDKEEYS